MQHNSQHYAFWIRLATTAAVVAAVSMILVKAVAWYMSESASMLASMTDSIFDVAASVFNLFVVRYALMPADREHRFGHGKAESLAGLAQAAFIMGSALLLIFHSVDRIKNPSPILHSHVAFYATLFSIVVTLALVTFQKVVVSKTGSVAIKADSMHYKSDLLMNLAVLVALWLTALGYVAVDGWFAIGIALYLMWGAKEIALESAHTLMDREVDDSIRQQIITIIKQQTGVLGVHDVRTRLSGPTMFVQMHLELADALPLVEAHSISDRVEQAIIQSFSNAEVLIHQDPVSVVSVKKAD